MLFRPPAAVVGVFLYRGLSGGDRDKLGREETSRSPALSTLLTCESNQGASHCNYRYIPYIPRPRNIAHCYQT